MDQNMKQIMAMIDRDELLCQLAEEASELAVAANKLRRSLSDENPTPISTEEAYRDLLCEVADVSNCLVALGVDNGMDRMFIQKITKAKAERWLRRLEYAAQVGEMPEW